MKYFPRSDVKLGDLLIIGILILLSFLPHVLFWQQEKQAGTGTLVAVVSIDGKKVDQFPLDTAEHQLVTYHPNDEQYNIVEVMPGKIRVKEDNSPDQIAVRTGWISKPGQTSICLPHRLVISLERDGKAEYTIY